jgi:ABC-type multidrug transport system fused ATPase/permease subunit
MLLDPTHVHDLSKEDRWIQRALDAREYELKWMVKSRLNSIMFNVLWTLSPILVSLVSFFTFVATGHVLTVSTAFTAIALFNMIRQPLNVIPAWIVQILQTGVALNRISTYLDEDEVSAQVSSLKGRATPGEEGLGLERASFKWNEVEEKPDGKAKKPVTNSDSGGGRGRFAADAFKHLFGRKKNEARPRSPSSASEGASTSTTAVGTDVLAQEDHKFELRDLSVRFPEGALTVVTGPTASGKTALLVR